MSAPESKAAAVAAAEAEVKAAYEEYRRGRVGKVETADMTVIGTAAARHGVRLTVELIRRITGGGSPNTIHPLIEHFTQVDLPHLLRENAAEVPEPLVTLWQQLEAAAKEAGKAELAGPRRELAEAQAALAEQRASLDADRLAVDAARAAADRVAGELRDAFESLQARNTALEADLDSARHAIAGQSLELGEIRERATGLAHQVATLTTQQVTLQTELQATHEARDAARREAAAAREDASIAREQAMTASALAASERTARGQAAAARDDEARTRQRAEERLADLGSQLTRERAAVDQLQRDVGEREARLASEHARAATQQAERDAARSEAMALQATVSRLERELGDAAQALAAARAALTHAAAERDRLQATLTLTLTRLGPAEPPPPEGAPA